MVISRRALLATGATTVGLAVVLGGARATHRLDDLASAAGLDPHPEPDPLDDGIVRLAARDLAALVVTVEAAAARHTSLDLSLFIAIGREHLDAVGGSTAATDVAPVKDSAEVAVAALAKAYRAAARARAADAVRAASPDLARVLASISAGLTQCAQAVKELS